MTAPASTPTDRAALVPGKKYRFRAKSAEEAVRIIHERMGPRGRVLAVEQVGGQGLGRLLGGSKLEIVAMIPPEPSLSDAQRNPVAAAAAQAKARAAQAAAAENEPDETAGSAPAGATGAYGANGQRPARRAAYEAPVEEKPLVEGGRDLRSILRRLGFSAELLAQFATEVDPRELAQARWTDKLDRFVAFLWQRYRELPAIPLTQQIAFMGTPGCGITTALCKELTASVFLRQEQPLVASLELETGSSLAGLQSFCELMQVPLVSEQRAALGREEKVLWDIPGIASRDFNTWRQVGARLDELGIGTRVFVSHAAFDSQHLLQLVRTLETVRPTHVVLTHLDEAHAPARLWDFLLACGCSPLFVSDSPSVTGGRRDDFHAALLAQTFPAHLNLKS